LTQLLPKGVNPQFLADIYCGQRAGCIRIPFGMEAGLGRGGIVRWGPAATPQRGTAYPPPKKKSTHLLWPKGWMHRLPCGTDVGLGPGDIVLDGDSAPRRKFGPCVLWPNGWMHQDTTWYRRIFGPCLLYCGQMVANLSYC